jgi:hypothetical protein
MSRRFGRATIIRASAGGRPQYSAADAGWRAGIVEARNEVNAKLPELQQLLWMFHESGRDSDQFPSVKSIYSQIMPPVDYHAASNGGFHAPGS